MPPKKKGSGKKKKDKQPELLDTGDPFEKIPENTKEYYLAQIKQLEQRQFKYQGRVTELDLFSSGSQQRYEQVEKDLKEAVVFLKKTVDTKGDEIADLSDRLIGLQQARDKEKDTFEKELLETRQTFQEQKDQQTAEIAILQGRLHTLEEFKQQREDLIRRKESLEGEMEALEASQETAIYNLEKKAVVDRDRMKKEIVQQVNHVASEFRKISNKQMAETTKRTIRENVSMAEQLTKLSNRAVELVRENELIREKEKEQRRSMDMLEETERQLARKNIASQQIVAMLTAKLQNQEEVIGELERRQAAAEEVQEEGGDLAREAAEARSHASRLNQDNNNLRERLEDVEKRLAVADSINGELVETLTTASSAIKDSLTNEKQGEREEDRMYLLQNLFKILASCEKLKITPQVGLKFEKDRALDRPSRLPGSAKGVQRPTVAPITPLFNPGAGYTPHYKPGDLGFVPKRQTRRTVAASQLFSELSHRTRIDNRAANQRVESQTVEAT